MKIKIQVILIVVILLLVVSTAFGQDSVSTEFVADMVDQSLNDTVTNKLYVKGSYYRIETEEEGMKIVVLVDQDSNITRVLNMDDKMYLELPSDDIKAIMNDPFQSLRITLETPGIEHKVLETDTINGHECVKHVLFWGENPFYTYYMSDKYNWPMKIIRGDFEKVVELKNIEDKEIDNSLFEIPEGFSELDKVEEKK